MSDPRPLPHSLYARTARPPVVAPPLDVDRRLDVAIVGGGFTGLSTALHLARRGADVAVLEAHEPGWGASGRNGGQVNPGLKHDPDAVVRDFGVELGRRMVALSSGAPQAVFDLVRDHQIACEARRGGTLRAAPHGRGLKAVEDTYRQYERHGAPVELIDRAGMAARTGTARYAGGVLDRRGGSLNPLGYARGLAEAAQRQGAAIHGATPVTAIARDGAAWRLTTPRATVRARQVVLATNGYTDDLWTKLRRTVVPVYSGIAATAPLPATVAAVVMPFGGVLFEVAAITVYYRLDVENRLLMGGRVASRDSASPADFAHLVRYAEKLWPTLGRLPWSQFWSGQLAMTADHYPHLHEPAPGVVAALGYNGRGVAMATAMGAQVAARLGGASPDALSMPITDLRPIRFHRLWKSGVRARVIYGRLRDWLGA